MKSMSRLHLAVMLIFVAFRCDLGLATAPEQTHDMAITDVSALSRGPRDYTVPVVVNIENQGECGESFDVKLIDVTDGNEVGRKSLTLPAKDQSGMDADLILTGESPGLQQFGNYVSHGDVNGDGYPDLLTTASNYGNNRGRAYLYFGGPDMDANADKIFAGENQGDLFGERGVYLSDLNNDGFDEVIVGALGYNSRQGRVYVFYGGLDMDENTDLTLEGETVEINFGQGIAIGDVNNDGYDDLFVGASKYENYKGRVYLYYGGDPFDTAVDKTFTGENTDDTFPREMSARGDVDGDGCNDLLIGTRFYQWDTRRGRAYLYFGAPGTNMDEICDVMFTGEHRRNDFASAIDLFDIDSDGHADVIIGARQYGSGIGRGYLYWGSNRATMDNVVDIVFDGEEGVLSNMGGDSVYCGHVNKDKFGDIIFAGYNYYRSDKRGRAYAYYGNTKASMDADCDRTLTGYQASMSFGKEVKLADLNGDGLDDVILGAYGYNDFQGRVHVFFSQSGDPACLTFNWDTTNATPGKHILKASITPVAGEEDTADNTMTVTVDVRGPSL